MKEPFSSVLRLLSLRRVVGGRNMFRCLSRRPKSFEHKLFSFLDTTASLRSALTRRAGPSRGPREATQDTKASKSTMTFETSQSLTVWLLRRRTQTFQSWTPSRGTFIHFLFFCQPSVFLTLGLDRSRWWDKRLLWLRPWCLRLRDSNVGLLYLFWDLDFLCCLFPLRASHHPPSRRHILNI